jgi:hypothetical protein
MKPKWSYPYRTFGYNDLPSQLIISTNYDDDQDKLTSRIN